VSPASTPVQLGNCQLGEMRCEGGDFEAHSAPQLSWLSVSWAPNVLRGWRRRRPDGGSGPRIWRGPADSSGLQRLQGARAADRPLASLTVSGMTTTHSAAKVSDLTLARVNAATYDHQRQWYRESPRRTVLRPPLSGQPSGPTTSPIAGDSKDGPHHSCDERDN
jgi:hypothetical protein